MNAQWLGDILLGDFEALRQVQCSRYAAFGLPDPFAPTQRLVWSLLGEWAPAAAGACAPPPARAPAATCFLAARSSALLCPGSSSSLARCRLLP